MTDRNLITQEKLKEILRYDGLTGNFYWRVGFNNVHIGDLAGCVHASRNGKKYRIIRPIRREPPPTSLGGIR